MAVELAKPTEPRPPESYLNQPETLVGMKKEIKENLLILLRQDKQLEDMRLDIKAILNNAKLLIDRLKQKYPKDPDIFVFEKMYKDFKGDYDRKEETELDSSFDQIRKDMKDIIKKSGIKKESTDKTSLGDTIQKLRAIGIDPEYVVNSGKPNAKTVVLFMQMHAQPGMSKELADKLGATGSQEQIKKSIDSAVKSGFIKDVYEEGIKSGKNVSLSDISKFPEVNLASIQSKREFGDRMNLKGYDIDELKIANFESALIALKLKSRKGDLESDYAKFHIARSKRFDLDRTTSHNILIASNFAELINKSDEKIAFMTLGAAHEKDFITNKGHPVKISDCLAYYGVNVVVVDAASKYFKMPSLSKK